MLQRRAFTLVEILIAILLMALAAVTTIGVVVVSARQSQANAEHAAATDLAEQWLEKIIASPYSSVDYGDTLPDGTQIPADNSWQTYTGTADIGQNTQWRLTITTNTTYKLIELEVRWRDVVTGQLKDKVFRLYKYDDSIVMYPYRPYAG